MPVAHRRPAPSSTIGSSARDVARGDVAGRQRARQPVRAQRHGFLMLLVVAAARSSCAAPSTSIDRLAEPARRAVADDLAAADEHEHGRDDRHREQRADELGAEPRERRRLPLLDPELEQVAREHEDQRDQQRQVDGEQRVQQHVGEQRRRDLARPARQPEQAGEQPRSARSAIDDEHARVVERAPARRPERRTGGGGSKSMALDHRMNVKSVAARCRRRGRRARARTCGAGSCAAARGRSSRRWARAARVGSSAI